MSLLPRSAFHHVFAAFAPFAEKRVGYLKVPGNVGDDLIHEATFQMFKAFGITWRMLDATFLDTTGVDVIAHCGGGNMGHLYRMQGIRRRAVETDLPVVILPQSFTTPTTERFDTVFARERRSLEIYSGSILAPDLALGYELETQYGDPTCDHGIFLRGDKEGRFNRLGAVDPVRASKSLSNYFHLASLHRRITTDRLHFAIVGLILGRDVTLLPNSYHKNRAMWETWLRDLGCKWADAPADR